MSHRQLDERYSFAWNETNKIDCLERQKRKREGETVAEAAVIATDCRTNAMREREKSEIQFQ